MILFVRENWGTIITALVVFAIAAGVAVNLVRNHRKSRCYSCGCGCEIHKEINRHQKDGEYSLRWKERRGMTCPEVK